MSRPGQTNVCPGRFTDAATWDAYRFHLAVERGRRPATVATYATTLDSWARFLHPKSWKQATSRDLERFLQRPVSAGPRAGQPLSAGVRRYYTIAICGLYRWAHRAGRLARDPMAAVDAGKAPTPIPRDLDLADVAALLDAADERVRVAVWLGYGCGLRVGEMARLRVEDVAVRGDRPHLRVMNGKGGKSRLVPLPPPVRVALAAYLAGRPTTGPLLERRRPGDVATLRPGTVSDMLREAMDAAGVKGTPHALRHTYATRLLEAGRGENLLTVSRLLGHSSTTLTEQVYGAGYLGELDTVAAMLPDPRGTHA